MATPLPPSVDMSNVYFFVPNLIGYGRIVFLFLFFLYAGAQQHVTAFVMYFISGFLDAFDGHAGERGRGVV